MFFAAADMGLEQIGMLAAVYPATWGVTQLATGTLSDRLGRKWLIASGMWLQALGIGHSFDELHGVRNGRRATRDWYGDGVSDAARRDWRCGAAILASIRCWCLSVLAGSWLCVWRPNRGRHRGRHRVARGNVACRWRYVHVRCRRCRAAGRNASVADGLGPQSDTSTGLTSGSCMGRRRGWRSFASISTQLATWSSAARSALDLGGEQPLVCRSRPRTYEPDLRDPALGRFFILRKQLLHGRPSRDTYEESARAPSWSVSI